jgi:hypothetical protein
MSRGTEKAFLQLICCSAIRNKFSQIEFVELADRGRGTSVTAYGPRPPSSVHGLGPPKGHVQC